MTILVSLWSHDHVAGFHFYPTSHPPFPWRMSSPANAVEESYTQEDTERRAAPSTGASRNWDSAQHASRSEGYRWLKTIWTQIGFNDFTYSGSRRNPSTEDGLDYGTSITGYGYWIESSSNYMVKDGD